MSDSTMKTMDDLHPDVLACVLRRMDGPTLAAVGCCSSLLRSLSLDPSVWRDLCLEAWPSLRLLPAFPLLSPPSFFADSFPFPDTDTADADTVSSSFNNAEPPPPRPTLTVPLPARVFSAVDIYYAGAPVFSRVVETDTSCKWFLGSVFRIDAVDCNAPTPRPLPAGMSPAKLELSWAVVDADTGRAVNVSSRQAVSVDRHWYTGEAVVRFATVLSWCAVSVVVTCREETGHVREVSMTVEDGDGIAASGRESLGIMAAAMRGKRRMRRRGNGGEETDARKKYREYLSRMRARKEMNVRKEGMMDLYCTGFGALLFLAFLLLLAFK